MEQPPRITTQPPELNSQNFEFLRAQGLSVIQDLAANAWTDHNLHDPGITLLEAICYAFTETGLRAGMDIRDLIATSAPFRQPEFFTAIQVLPTAPVKLSDFRKLIINHPLVENAWVFPITSLPMGRLSILLEFSNDDPNDDLNTNNFVETVTPAALTQSYTVELAFPHWNEDDITPLQQNVELQLVAFDGPPGDEWNNIVGGQSFFARALITYQPSGGGPQVMQVWVVANIITEMDDPLTEAPLILQDVIDIISTLGDNSETDQTMLKKLNRKVTLAFESMRQIRRYISPYRNLCEDIHEFNAVRLQEVSVSAIIEVGSGVNIEELLAEIYLRIYRMISPSVHFNSLEDQLKELATADDVFDGPITDAGFLSESSLGKQQIIETVYTSDILRIIYQLRNADDTDVVRRENLSTRKIIAVRSLSLSNYLDNRPITSGARDCLRLVKSKNHVPRLSVTKSRISVYRNGIPIAYDNNLVFDLFAEKLTADTQADVSPLLDLPVPAGETYAINDFYPIQNDLPLVYGVGEAGLPEHVSTTRKAQARQLKGYLFFFEQMLAGSQAQLAAFNTFFSADPEINRTLFQQDIYQIPDIAPLFKAYDMNADDPVLAWSNFQNDEANPYMEVLNHKVETREQFLARRNAMLDHLLATQGEDMQDRAALLFRLAAQVPEGFNTVPLTNLLNYQNQERLQALRNLIYDKSAYYYDLPTLNRDKGQAYGHPLWRENKFLEINKVDNLHQWIIKDASGNPLFKESSAAESLVEVYKVVEQVMKLATEPQNYTIRLEEGTFRRLEIRTSPTAEDPIAESIAAYATDPLADDAIQAAAVDMVEIWTTFALIPLECKLYHILGIDIKEKRQLAYDINDYVEIFDEVDADPFIEKRFRLWSESGFAGDELLASVDHYEAPTNDEAIAAAKAAVQQMIDYGIEADNYIIENPAPNTFLVALQLPGETVLAQSPQVFTSESDATEGILRIQSHLYQVLRTEGFYMLENHLLFPPETTHPDLVIPDQSDPYSFQLTVVLPSGYARDFAGGDPEPAQPSLYRNVEFRKYAEQQIRKHCPAHILPRIMWVDRILAGEIINPADPSFEAFEQAYMAWLSNYMIDEVSEAIVGPARDNLTNIVNELYQGYYTD